MFPELFAAANNCVSPVFFGLVPWYAYLPQKAFTSPDSAIPTVACNIYQFQVLPQSGTPSDIPYILLAVVDDLLRIAGLVAVAFLIYASVRYVTSQGSPDQTSKAHNTIINALAGLAIALVAIVFVSYLGSTLGG
jgi:hypothetical protein